MDNLRILNQFQGVVIFSVFWYIFEGEIQYFQQKSGIFCEDKTFPHVQFHVNSSLSWPCDDKRKATSFKSYFCVSCALYFATLLTIENGPFLPTHFWQKFDIVTTVFVETLEISGKWQVSYLSQYSHYFSYRTTHFLQQIPNITFTKMIMSGQML